MKFYAIAALLLVAEVSAIRLTEKPANVNDVQLRTKSRAQALIETNNQLFAQLHEKIAVVQKEVSKGTEEGDKAASIGAAALEPVVDNVQQRWLASIDKEEPEIVDEFLSKMKEAIDEIHATEGYPKRKIKDARDGDDDWLTKIVEQNHKMQALIPKKSKEDRVAIADS
uniref:Uncharacterized protein n=1 Tax=Strombidium inclinatum TaxID=197538 RepID=A0A7S3IIY8_9SPIT|eukprot:CAMPEP_0170492952 /NCGR_PEP_ID=MMETSP0208-20121228/13123_1 /TAXON_ID=197538 /ORGANISM="Strombidium inclinatum, Strain S3" /LENGTH=168 /DNA_ID=CAMNT_0010768795 /DNA_START=1 /DNA_END=507 /DNA_ORIENTATION=+